MSYFLFYAYRKYFRINLPLRDVHRKPYGEYKIK